MSVKQPQLPKYTPPAGGMPPFVPADPNAIESQAVAMDKQAYGLSDADFRQRYPQLYNAQQGFLNNLNTQMTGNITPQMQNVWATSGLGGALKSTGNWSLGSGTTGMANIARNLGLDQMSYQNNLLNQFNTANEQFKPRTFGISGADTAQISLANLAGQNNWNQANWAYKVQADQYNNQIAAQQAVIGANAQNQDMSTLVGAGSSAVSLVAAVAFACWLAREAFGIHDPRWKIVRHWVLNVSPAAVRWLYLRHGRSWARWLAINDAFKPAVRFILNWLIRDHHYSPCPL